MSETRDDEGGLSPIVMMIGNYAVHHGERDDSESCLCGHPVYHECPAWRDADGGIGNIVVSAS